MLKDLSEQTKGYIYFSSIPPNGQCGKKSMYPFTVTFNSPLTGEDDNVVNLYSQYSRSIPYSATQDKYRHLIPTWRFEDTNGDVIDSITLSSTVIYSSGIPIGTEGTADFYYIDDMPSLEDRPVILWATLEVSGLSVDEASVDVSGYSNSLVVAGTQYFINQIEPHKLKITSNGISDINQLKWTEIKFPYYITIHGDELIDDCYSIDGQDPILFDYPSSNEYGLTQPISVGVLGIPASSYESADDPLYFQRTDTEGRYIGGFARSSMIVDDSLSSAYLTASTNLEYTYNYPKTPYVWVSNPEHRTINRVSLPYKNLPEDYELAFDYYNPYFNAIDSQVPYNAPYILEVSPTNMWAFSGYGGIFGMAVAECNSVWGADAEMDYLYKFNPVGQLLSSIELSAGSTPAGISLDSQENLYVSLFDSVSVMRYSTDGDFSYYISPSSFSLDEFDNNDTIPTMVCTDKEDNIWVAYAHITNSMVVKYHPEENSYTELLRLSLPISSTPVDLNVDATDNSIWIANAYSHVGNAGSVQKYSTIGTLISSLDYDSPSFLTLDVNNDLWFTFGDNNVAYIPSLGSPVTFSVQNGEISSDLFYDRYEYTEMGGIGSDNTGYVWAINGKENKIYRVYPHSTLAGITSSLQVIEIFPNNDDSWFVEYNEGDYTYPSYTDSGKRSAQAYGDWTGHDWSRKYSPIDFSLLGTTLTATLTGISNEFEIRSFEEANIIRRYNESWDAASQIKEYALSEHIQRNTVLFDVYMSAMLGGNKTEDQHVGRLSYERIANFAKNHSDVDVSGINQLYSLANEVDVPIDDYKLAFPSDVRRMMDILSIDHQRLWGARCKCNKNFNHITGAVCKNCGHLHDTNIGNNIYTNSYIVTAGQTFIVKKRYMSDSYDVIDTVPYDSQNTYALSSVSAISWLISADFDDYEFYEHVTDYCNIQVEGIINWGDEFTTLSESNSSIYDWYTENGIVEAYFDYLLHKGLLNNG